MTTLRPSFLAASLAAAFPAAAAAQQQPNAGEILQQQRQQAPQPSRNGPTVDIPAAATPVTAPGGTQVTLTSVSITGASVFTEAELLAALGDVTGKNYDLAGLRALAERLSAYYREHGYPFARALLPEQSMKGGRLRIEVVEGRYGRIQAIGNPALTVPAERFLVPLKTGDVIVSPALERATLILDDQPGVKIAPIMRPGQEVGTGDLDVRVERTPGFSGDVGLDNQGNRYTGAYRAHANLQWDSPFLFGDQITLQTLYSDENMWLGNLGYSLPLGGSGLRGNIGYAHTYYELGKDFANLGATGTADVSSVGVTYPIVRSQKTNLTFSATYQHKALDDKQRTVGTDGRKSSDSLPIALNFDRRDALWGGGITYGALTYTNGRLDLDGTLALSDIASGQNTRGSFNKWNLDVARVQATPVATLTLFGRLSSQWTGKNLDSSESFGLGGANGVRAYPSGEGYGDEGWLVQMEMRYAMGVYSPYAFYDAGQVKTNADPDSLAVAPTSNNRSIAGTGLGVRFNAGAWNVDAAVAWRTQGGVPLSDTDNRNPRFWLTVGYRF